LFLSKAWRLSLSQSSKGFSAQVTDWAARFDIIPLSRNIKITATADNPFLLPMDWSPYFSVTTIKKLAADYRNGEPLCQTNDGVDP
jgi:hypothetical protein